MKLITHTHLIFYFAFLTILSGLIYLPLVNQIGYINDDWYLMYVARVAGPDIFHQVFASDRPMRAYVMGPAFELFGLNPLPWHISAWFLRLVSAFSLFWLGKLLWPKQNQFAAVSALLFLVYPGFLSQINPIDYQSQLLGLALGILSIALTVYALKATRLINRWLLVIISILLGWITLGLVDYFFGFEVFRFSCIFLIVWQKQLDSLRSKIMDVIWKSLPFLLSPVGFLIWKIFLFDTERRATSVTAQIGGFLSSPFNTAGWWLVHLFQDILNTIFLAWAVPLYSLGFSLRLRDSLIAIVLAILLGGLVWILINKYFHSNNSNPEDESFLKNFLPQPIILGLIVVVGGLLPVTLANRHIEFLNYSRYTLTGAAGAVIVVTSLLFSFQVSSGLRNFLISLLVGLSAWTHYANAFTAVNNQRVIQDFWWQVAWRAPQIMPGTVLTAKHGGLGLQEDYFIWGPANQIYYPHEQTGDSVTINLPAVILANENLLSILSGKDDQEGNGRGSISSIEYDNILVLTQPSSSGCVRILDGAAPNLSSLDDNSIKLIASQSKLENVLTNGDHEVPPVQIFGNEPEHGWCYFYQKASLAQQQNEWQQVINLEEEALESGYYPGDSVEWLPFFQAYARMGNQTELRRIARVLRADPYLAQQVCQQSQDWALTSEVINFINQLMCNPK